MPTSSETHRARIGLFQPRLITILQQKVERSTRLKKFDPYSPFTHWDFFTDLSYRLVVTTLCCIVFLVSVKCVVLATESEGLCRYMFDWFGGNIRQGLHDCGTVLPIHDTHQ